MLSIFFWIQVSDYGSCVRWFDRVYSKVYSVFTAFTFRLIFAGFFFFFLSLFKSKHTITKYHEATTVQLDNGHKLCNR